MRIADRRRRSLVARRQLAHALVDLGRDHQRIVASFVSLLLGSLFFIRFQQIERERGQNECFVCFELLLMCLFENVFI